MRVLVLALALFVATAPDARARLSPAEVQQRSDALAAELRCPVCQALSVRDSPSDVAKTMRARIRELVAAGRSDEEVRAFFVRRYGDWILLSPPRRGIGLAVWALPPVLLLAGLLLVVLSVRRWTGRAQRLAEEGERRPDALAHVRRRMAEIERIPAASPSQRETR